MRKTIRKGWSTLQQLCKQHRAKVYFKAQDGTVGVHNHAGRICWYTLNLSGWSLIGITDDPYGAVLWRIDKPAQRTLFS